MRISLPSLPLMVSLPLPLSMVLFKLFPEILSLNFVPVTFSISPATQCSDFGVFTSSLVGTANPTFVFTRVVNNIFGNMMVQASVAFSAFNLSIPDESYKVM